MRNPVTVMKGFRAIAVTIATVLPAMAYAHDTQTVSDRLPGIQPYMTASLAELVPNLYMAPTWISGTESFWYQRSDSSGSKYLLVDAATGKQKAAFDQVAMADALGKTLGRKLAPAGLPIWALIFSSDMKSVTVTADGRPFMCDLPVTKCAPPSTPDRSSISPDGRQLVYLRGNDLWLRNVASGSETQVTHDGIDNFSYGDIDGNADLLKLLRTRLNLPHPLDNVIWSPDGRYALAIRQDLRPVSNKLLVLDYFPPDGSYENTFYARASTVSDKHRPDTYLTLIDTATGKSRPMQNDSQAFNDWALAYILGGVAWWPKDGHEVYFITANRGGNHYALTRMDLESGQTKNVIDETAKFYVRMSSVDYTYPNVHVTSDGKQALWYSERDGWGHIYLYDLPSGKLVRQITKGPWVVTNILRVDETKREVYFTATGREPGRDPYYRHLYRVSMDGGEPKLLTPEDADHDFNRLYKFVSQLTAAPGSGFSSSGKYFVDTFSTMTQPAATIVRDSSGKFVANVFKIDASGFNKLGLTPPERVSVKAADGKTDIYGVVYKPLDFDLKKKYPIVDITYPGPTGHWAPVTFRDCILSASFNAYAYNKLGFVVVSFDGRGTGARSSEFRDAFGGTEDPLGAADQVAAIRNLAGTRPYMDVDRVGVMGGSFGGYASVRDMLLYPKFFKVGVSTVGPQDFRHLLATVERFFGDPTSSKAASDYYDLISNTKMGSRLDGKLLLVHGLEDENVPFKSAAEMYAALIQADKTFDTLVIPDAAHDAGENRYVARRAMAYFLDNLGGPVPQ